MALNQQDINSLVEAMKKAGMAATWKQTLTLCATIAVFSLGFVTWWTTRLDRVEDKLDARMTIMDTRLRTIDQSLQGQGEILARLDERSTKIAISTNTIAVEMIK
jgi:hypothetical protein